MSLIESTSKEPALSQSVIGGEASKALPPPPLQIPQLIWSLLFHRGHQTAEEVNSILSPKLKDMKAPDVLDGMGIAVERLVQAFENNDPVCIYADFDLDGTSGLALLFHGLKELGFKNLSYYQPKRLSEGYGVHISAVEQLAEKGVKVMVSVDVGITAHDAVDVAGKLGIDFIVTDHHLPKDTLPAAYAVVNPNKKECSSGLGYLSGAGVAFYLFLALRRKMMERELYSGDFEIKKLLDYFVIGTLTDMVPVVGENRVLIKHGLKVLEKTTRPGLRQLLKSLDLWGRPLTSSDVAIRFAPKLNALSRLELGILPLDLFLVEQEEEAIGLVTKALSFNEKRIDLQKSAEKECLDWLEENPPEGFVFYSSKNFHKGVIGLVATKVMQKYNVPAFIGTVTEDDLIIGSGRAPKGYSLLSAMGASSEYLVKFGGHAPAAGFQMNAEQAEGFRAGLTDFYKALESVEVESQSFDGMGQLGEVNESFMRWHDQLEPFGSQFPVPVFKFSGVRVESMKVLKGAHLKLKLQDPETFHSMEALWFSVSDIEGWEKRLASQTINVYAEVQRNYFMGRKTLQLMIREIECLPSEGESYEEGLC